MNQYLLPAITGKHVQKGKLFTLLFFLLFATSSSLLAHSVTCAVNTSTQCLSGNVFNFTATPTDLGLNPTFDWDFGDGSAHSTAQNPSHTYATAGSYTATCNVLWTSDGFTANCTKAVTVNAKPNAGPNASVIAGNCATLTGTSPTTGTWTAQSGNPSGATLGSTSGGVASACFNSSSSGTYNFIYTISTGCSDTVTITVNPKPNAGSNTTACGGSCSTLTGTSPSTGTWTAQSGNPSGATVGSTSGGVASACFINAASGTYNFIYTVSGGGTDTVAVVVSAKPNAGTDMIACASSCTNLTGTAPTTGTWTAMGTNPAGATLGSTSGGVASVCFNSSAFGTYNFIYTSGSCSDTVGVTVSAKPNAGANQTACGGSCNTLTGTSPTTGTWTAMSGNPAGATLGSTSGGIASVCFTNSSSGAYNFIYTSGSCSDTVTVTVSAKPNAGIDKTVCYYNGSVTMTATGSGVWTAQAGNPGTSNIATPSSATTTVDNFNSTGTYNYIFTNGSCSDTVSVVVTPSGTIGNYVWTDTNGDGINNEAASAGINGVTVELWNATTNTLITSTVTANNAGNPGYYNFPICNDGDYKVKFPTTSGGFVLTTQTATASTDNNSDANTSTGFSPTFTMTLSGTGTQVNNPTIDAGYLSCSKPNAGANQTACAGSCMNITGTSPTTGTWAAQSGNPVGATVGATVAGVANICFTNASIGTYSFIYTVGTCTDTMNVLVKTNSTSSTSATICSGGSYTFNGSTYSSAGTYVAHLTNANGCDSAATLVLTVNPAPTSGFAINTNLQEVCGNNFAFTSNTPTAGNTYSWTFGDGGSSTLTNPSNVYVAAGTYSVKQVVTASGTGCKDSVTINAIVTSCGVTPPSGVETKSIGDIIAKIEMNKSLNNVNRAVDYATMPHAVMLGTTVVNGAANGLQLSDIISGQITNRPTLSGYISTPANLISFTNAIDVMAVDYTKNNLRKAVVFGTKTIGEVYNHTKQVCDRLKGAEVSGIQTITVNGIDLTAYTIQQHGGEIEYAISLSAGKKAGRNTFNVQSYWLNANYENEDTLLNFQLWAADPTVLKDMATDIMNRLSSIMPVVKLSTGNDLPSIYMNKSIRIGKNLSLDIANAVAGKSGYFKIDEKKNELSQLTTRIVPFNFNTNGQTNITVPVGDTYESSLFMYIDNKLVDLVYLNDGAWSINYDKSKTTISKFTVSNETNANINSNELTMFRKADVTATTSNYVSVYKLVEGGGLELNLTNYKGIKFNASAAGSGTGTLKVTLVKKSVTNWNEQFSYTLNINNSSNEYAIGFNQFTSSKGGKLTADDIMAVNFSFENNSGRTSIMNASVAKLRFTKEDIAYQQTLAAKAISIYPNPNNGKFTANFMSEVEMPLVLRIIEVSSGATVLTKFIDASKGLNSTQIDISHTASTRNYIIALEGDGMKYDAKKIMIQKK